MIYLDATSISTFLKCREAYRQRNIENRTELYPAIHLAFGSAVHTGVEHWHKGLSYRDCLALAVTEMTLLDADALNRFDRAKWDELGDSLPSVIAAYCDAIEPEPDAEIEQEWMYPYGSEVTLVGKIDRYAKGVLYDVKTASEVAPPKNTLKSWKQVYRDGLLRRFQFGFYDWYLRHRISAEAERGSIDNLLQRSAVAVKDCDGPLAIKVEVIVKPYRDKKSRVEIFDLPEVLVYRKRFDQQLAEAVDNIVWLHQHALEQKPWLMAGDEICQGKFSACDYLPLCNLGEGPKVLALYQPRREHLECLKNLRASSG